MTYSTTVGIALGFFWVSYFIVNTFPWLGIAEYSYGGALAFYYGTWLAYSTYMTIAGLFYHLSYIIYFLLLDLIYLTMTIGCGSGLIAFNKIAGYTAIVMGVYCNYLACITIVRDIFPVFQMPLQSALLSNVNWNKLFRRQESNLNAVN
jgi:succinate-acetate transporter protein